MTGDTDRGSDTLREAAKGFRYLFWLNLLSKAFTFGANAYIVRVATPEAMGMRLNMDLWVNAVLFFTREAFRTACLRISLTEAKTHSVAYQQTLNWGWCSALFGIVLSVIAACAFYYTKFDDFNTVDDFKMVSFTAIVLLNFLGAAVECLAEPLYNTAQGLMISSLRTNSEAAALVSRIVTMVSLVSIGGYHPLVAFAAAQIVYGVIVFLYYYGYFWIKTPGRKWSPDFSVKIPSEVSANTVQFQKECTMRLLLTEGEKVILSGITTLSQQGVYDVVSHLGSVVCRILFKFIEDASLVAWSKLFSVGAIKQAQELYKHLIRVLSLVGLVFCCFGTSYSYSLLYIVYGSRWTETDAPSMLSLYCVYIALMAINGISEAFYRSAATDENLQLLWKVQGVFSATFVSSALLLERCFGLGAFGLITASASVMVLRIAFCLRFATSTLPDFNVTQCLPHPIVVLIAVASFAVTQLSRFYIYPSHTSGNNNLMIHIYVGALCFLAFLVSIKVLEWSNLQDLRKLLSGKTE